ncbi:thiamine phosphate synthase [Thermomonas mangrovi]|uniref:thiamine phosphate synthase n=1 Tax=Thermomonas mangrovi TaxID=2993316 RepID=UPI002307B262|nr:thiamine phosphate synthase [Thermomonas mangrovi]
MTRRQLPRGLYLLTPDEHDGERLLARTLPLLPFASCVQLRAKGLDRHVLMVAGQRLRKACREADVAFIVNDDPGLARELDADGVHLGEDDASVDDARRLLGDAAIIGVSCYDDLARARRLASEGADYLAFGAFFPSPTKPRARRASLQLLRDSAAPGLPRVAIGGITPENGGPLVAAGADLLAVISGVFDAADPAAAARAYLYCFKDPTPA